MRLHRCGELAKLELGQANAVQRHAAQVYMPGGEHLVVDGVRGGQGRPVVALPQLLGEHRERRPMCLVAAVHPRRTVHHCPQLHDPLWSSAAQSIGDRFDSGVAAAISLPFIR
ncbi:hypothetical protein SAZ11_59385 [Streptomyces sp. FXJ1.4098]|nr:hypothetical protein [Streptomyces sp. FXJ1.4098]